LSETDEDGQEQQKGSIAEDVALSAVTQGGCCLLYALTAFALLLSAPIMMLVNR
jgi:hypothetical protein